MEDSSCIHSLRIASARRLIRSTVSSVLPPSRRGVVARFDGQMTQLGKDWRHSGIWISEKDTATNTNEDPPESLQNGLSFEVVVKLLLSVPALAIAFYSEPPSLTLDDKVNAVRTDRPLRVHSIAGGVKPTMDELLKHRFRSPALFLDRSH